MYEITVYGDVISYKLLDTYQCLDGVSRVYEGLQESQGPHGLGHELPSPTRTLASNPTRVLDFCVCTVLCVCPRSPADCV
jgi:hypothetical protein